MFESCGRHRSFAKAAIELSITPGAVSQQIKSLEESLGVVLFKRKARGVEFTPYGEQYFIEIRTSFDILDAATRRLKRADVFSEVTISIENSLALNWLMPRLPDFYARHPQTLLHVAARPLPRNEATRYSDIAIAYGRRSYAGLKVQELMSERLLPVCSPEFLDRIGPFDGPEWFRRAPLIHDLTFGSDLLLPDWQGWLESVGFPNLPSESGARFASSALCLGFAAAGGGVALARSRLAEGYFSERKLVNPTQLTTLAPSQYFLVGSPIIIERPAVQTLVGWLIQISKENK